MSSASSRGAESTHERARGELLALLQAAIARVDGRAATRRSLLDSPIDAPGTHFSLVAVGKAAGAMALGAHDALEGAIAASFIVTKDGHVPEPLRGLAGATILETAHPLPDERSVAAGEALLRWLDARPKHEALLFLVSGGASSLIELPAPGVSLAELRALASQGLASGLSIGELNARRARLSRLKAGGLTRLVAPRAGAALFVSDVPGDDPRVIGSGLLAPVPGDRIERRIVARLEDAMQAASDRAREDFGHEARVAARRFDEDVEPLAARLVRELETAAEPLCVWGGESTVRLPERPGQGGRNQQLALHAARHLAGYAGRWFLAAGTDGTDGPTADAGALVDGETCRRIELAGLSADECLARADAGRALAASGDLLHTGPTGTNVGDLVIGLKNPTVL